MNNHQQPLRASGFRTVRSRMLFWILVVTIPLYGGALYISYEAAARRLEAGAERDADELAARLAAQMDAVVRPIEGGIRTVAYQLEEVNPPPSQYAQRIRGILNAWPDVYGSTIAVETGNGGPSTKPFAPYYFRRANAVEYSDLALESYGYRELPWYRRAADSLQPVWSAPYFDEGGGDIWMVTYSVPFFRKSANGRALSGVVTADLDLNWVRRAAAAATLGMNGMGWLSTPPDGRSFVAPLGATAARISAFDPSLNEAAIRAAGEAMLAKRATFALLPAGVTAKPAYLAARNLETLEWRVMLLLPQSEVLSEARALLNRLLWLGAVGLVLLLVAISIVAAGIARPIHALAESVGTAARGDEFDFKLPDQPRRDEVGVLTDALRRMRNELREHIRLRAESLAEQARLEHELQIAASIQQSMLPNRTDAANLPPSVEVAAALLPAKQVGGDLYDYFKVRDGNLLFAIGDVSDKGIPAALFMARLSALLRVLGADELPDRLLSAINSRLVEGNDACMFVTIGCGVLNVDSGRIRYASAGHEPPLLREVDGRVRALAAENGAAIGIETAVEYRLYEGSLAPGDALVLFTDGVTEAEGPGGTLWGIDRLTGLIGNTRDSSPGVLVKNIVDAVASHSGGFHATDDLTVLAVRFNPARVSASHDADVSRWRLDLDATLPGIQLAQQRLRCILESRGIASERIGDVDLVVEELLTNVVKAADTDRKTIQLTMNCALTPLGIEIVVRDDGTEFNPLSRPDPDLDADIVDRGVGGLGVHLIKQLADECSYARVDGLNVFMARFGRTSTRS